jgi:hypothetical protein
MASFCSTSRTETPRRAISASSSPTCSTSLGASVLSGGEQQMPDPDGRSRSDADRRADRGAGVAHAPQQRAAQILEHRQPAEDRGDLKASRQAHPVDPVRLHLVDPDVVEQDRAGGEVETAADQVEQRSLAGAVRADDGVAFALRDVEADAADDLEVAERLADIAE